jgi:DNA mismatch repair protein MutS2
MFSLQLLEYEKVLELFKEHCVSEYSKKKLDSLTPSVLREKTERSFSELRETLFLITSEVPVVIEALYDTTGLLTQAQIENNYLDPVEILRIRKNIDSFVALKRKVTPFSRDIPLLWNKIAEVRTLPHLRERIEKVIDEHAHVREDATPRLAEIFRKLRETRSEIEKILEGYISSQETREALQERHITMKDDRYVIPVKQHFKGRIPGIIHAESGSGETVFIEPFSITSRNNELRLLEKERDLEERKLLVALTSEIGKNKRELTHLQETLADFDILHAKSMFMKNSSCSIPEFCEKREIRLWDARHPLVKGKVVPIDFVVESGVEGVVITGPNTGGKTVSLKTIGLFVLLAQAGFPVPAKEMKSFFFGSVFADIGDEQSIEQSLSTFSGHIRNIKRIIDEADEHGLVLIDELGAGTDPVEGGALGTSILDYLVSKGVFTIVTTHFSTIKMYALSSEKIRVASVQFDTETCRPTYKLVMGIAGRSNALEIARHLGLKKEILDNALVRVPERERSVDRIFQNLGKMEMGLSRKEQSLKGEEKKLRELIEHYRSKLESLGKEEHFIRHEYRRELEKLLADYSSRLERNIQKIREEGATKQRIKAAREERENVEKEFSEDTQALTALDRESASQISSSINVGDFVRVQPDFGGTVCGEVVEKKDDKLIVQAGIFRLTVEQKDVVLEVSRSEEPHRDWEYEPSQQRGERYECDLRGMRYQEAMEELVKFLDNAILSNIRRVSIIHGMGTGALRQGVLEMLRKNRHVEHFEYAHPEQGGYGCTIVTLKS